MVVDAHLLGVAVAHERHRDAPGDDALAVAAGAAIGYYSRAGRCEGNRTEAIGAFVRAYVSAWDALGVEVRDRQAVFGVVADEWWVSRPRGASYGAPWGAVR